MNYTPFIEQAHDYTSYQEMFMVKSSNPELYNYGEYIPMNAQRSQRIDKTFQLNEEQIQQIQNIEAQIWLVITEHWCGDASQIVPVIAKFAQESQGKIQLKLVYRDEVTELMNAHLTNGGMAVPKIVKLDTKHQLLGDWGPRPKAAQEMVIKLKSNPDTASTYIEELHRWYAKDKQQSVTDELIQFALATQKASPM